VHCSILRAADERRVSPKPPRVYGPAPIETDWTGVPDIFDEVEEDLRAERARRLARRYGGAGVALLVAILVVTGSVVWWQQHRGEAASAVAGRFIAGQKTADASAGTLGHPDHAAETEASRQLSAVAADSPAGYRTLAQLRLAALQWQMGDTPRALATWQAVSEDEAAPPLLRDLATLTSGEHQVDTGNPAQVKQRLATLTSPDNHWRPMAEEAIALLDLRMGKQADAATILQRLSADPLVPQSIREMSADLLTTLDVSAPPPSPAPPAPAPAPLPPAKPRG